MSQNEDTRNIGGGRSFEERVMARFDAMDARFDSMGRRFDVVEDRLETMAHRLDAVESRLDKIESRLDVLDQRLTKVEDRLTKVEDRLSTVEDRISVVEQALEARVHDTRPMWEVAQDRLTHLEAQNEKIIAKLDRVDAKVNELGNDLYDMPGRVRLLERNQPVG